MIKKMLLLCVGIALSVNSGCAGKGKPEVTVPPPLIVESPAPSPTNFAPAPSPTNLATASAPSPLKFTTDMEFVYIKGGCYQMGDIYGDGESQEKPVHEVCVDDFYIGKYEVTQGQWKKIMGNNPSFYSCGDNCPVENVSWNDAQDFIRKLNGSSSGSIYRLPTEAEFEYAARSGGNIERYSGGNDVDSVAWYGANAQDTSHPVGSKDPNGLGLYDMSGNLWEWTSDWYDTNYYASSPRNNPTGPDSGVNRSVRGGCLSGPPENMRMSRRTGYPPDIPQTHIGFRLVRTR